MSERTTELLLDALKRALVGPGEQRLYKSGKLDGLFPSRQGSAAEAAQVALSEGLLEVVRTEERGKTAFEWVRVTPRGVDFLHEQESPVRALRELRAELRCNQQAVPVWVEQMRSTLRTLDERLTSEARCWSQRLGELSRVVEDTLRRIEVSAPLLPPDVVEKHPWAIDALNYLDRRRNGGAPSPCSLSELYAALTQARSASAGTAPGAGASGLCPQLAIGAFHEGLRRLNECRAIHLKSADNLSDLAQPEYALLDAGQVLYYAER